MTSIFQEDKGLIKIYNTCIDMNAIWRPTPRSLSENSLIPAKKLR